MITSAASNNFTNTTVLKQRFQKLAHESSERQEIVDKLERMGTSFLALDGTEFDQDEAPGSVAIGDDKGLIALVQAHPFGGVLSMDVLDERGGEVKEYSIEPDMFGVSYSMDIGGVNHSVYQTGNGLLALMSQISDVLPPEKDQNE